MSGTKTYIGSSKLKFHKPKVDGKFVIIEKERYFKIENYDAMPPFLMSIVSDSDHWMFISSSGGMTAGRKNPDRAIFPYYTDDKIHESSGLSGSKSIIRVRKKKRAFLWEPFSNGPKGLYKLTKNLYKSTLGNKVIFEEVNHDLELIIRIKWMNSDRYGWIRETRVVNLSETKKKIELLDGLHNILPSGILKNVQEQFSTLMDAYKKSELVKYANLGVFSLSSIPVDRAEPSEALRASTVWTTALNVKNIILSDRQWDQFRISGECKTEKQQKGIRGAYMISMDLTLEPAKPYSHYIIADVYLDSTAVKNLITKIESTDNPEKSIKKDIERGSSNLFSLVSKADGVQVCGDERLEARHFSNVLFNIMRGGIYENGYKIFRVDLKNHIQKFNTAIAKKYANWCDSLEEEVEYCILLDKALATNDEDLYRIILEFLPLTFSRRHGDPSRPWNRFSIDVRNSDGSKSLSYEGNWRDIFQNWEALSYSYPHFLGGIISKFLNASTADGYNPYRITHKGIDWETFDPEDPWSFIGYWGDHQIIYLLKLMELYNKLFPGKLSPLLEKSIYTFANVPYRIKPYSDIIANPNSTIVFDESLHTSLIKKEDEIGADGKLLTDSNGNIIHSNLLEKLLIPLLTKLSNFIPEAGIWLNTQRPEWNDANNALVGNGVSMVTLYYLRRYVSFLHTIVESKEESHVVLAEETSAFFKEIQLVFIEFERKTSLSFSDEDRKNITDALGIAGSHYREKIYRGSNRAAVHIGKQEILSFLLLALKYIDQSIASNKRSDGLYHAYKLIEIDKKAIKVKQLPLMLEGQVAFLSSGYAGPDEVIEVLKNLRTSDLYRPDQNSYILYPDKELPAFIEKNIIPEDYLNTYAVLPKIMNGGGYDIIFKDNSGGMHFHGDFKNAGVLKERISQLDSEGILKLGKKESAELLEIYESLFNHEFFTGRSGSFFKYEGLGSIYWHMISKLLLAVGENIQKFTDKGLDTQKINELKIFYTKIREGIGMHKNPKEYGAIPTDPYSHTPSMLGAQQPGMTGQVKEDIISRWFELGIQINDGKISISTDNITRSELTKKGELSFTFCGIPFTYVHAEKEQIIVHTSANKKQVFKTNEIDAGYSSLIFSRSSDIEGVSVFFKMKNE